MKKSKNTMKKSKLKELIRETLMELDVTTSQPPEPSVEDHEAEQDYKQQTNQTVVREEEDEDEGQLSPEEQREFNREFAKWKSQRGNDDSGYDLNDPKHPSYSDRMADKADRFRDDAKYRGLDETKALSGMKVAPAKLDNTQMGYEDKSITSTSEPKEKSEGKKLPVVKKPAQPKKVNEVLAQLVKEVVDEYRTKGAPGKANPNRTTAVKATGLNYQSKGIAPRAPKEPTGKKTAAVNVYYDSGIYNNGAPVLAGKKALIDFDFLNTPWPATKRFIETEIMAELPGGAAVIGHIGEEVYKEIEQAKENDLDGKLTPQNSSIVLFYDKATKQLRAKTEMVK